MRINEVAEETGLSRRAVKYYEEQGLIRVAKDENGYRNYTQKELILLKEISVYRKLGIRIADIRRLLKSPDSELLEQICRDKSAALQKEQAELNALRAWIQDHNIEPLFQTVDYETVAQAIQDMIPGFYGYYFMQHFLPYLQIRISTPEQRQAYQNILNFWDSAKIRIPLFMKLSGYLMYRFTPKPALAKSAAAMDAQIQLYLHPSEEEYVRLREQTRRNVKLKNSILYRYHPAFIAQRRFMRRLQDQGYNDVFIPNMIALSPKYKEYHDALTQINHRICRDLGLYYDSDYQLVMKEPADADGEKDR